MLDLQQNEITRYSRHYPIIGLHGQKKLKNARVLCIGAGGLGCPALQYLAAAGIGTLGIIDGDVVELSNLQRQILFTEADIGRKKSQVIAERLRAMNQHSTLHFFIDFFSKDNCNLIQEYDVILDATDNYEARYFINQMCRHFKKTLISASVYQYEAQIGIFNHLDGPCYQCLYPEPPPHHLTPNCAVGGVIGVLPGVAGTLQASEAIKIILGSAESLSGKLLCFDLATLRFNQFDIPKQNCSEHPPVSFAPPKNTNQYNDYLIHASELNQLLQSGLRNIHLIDVREPYEREICHIGGELIPLADLADSLDAFDKEQTLIFYCKSGGRSKLALEVFLDAGFQHVYHLDGGILEWQETIDPDLTRY